MDLLIVFMVVMLALIIVGVLLGQLNWDQGIRYIVIIAVLVFLVWFILTRV